MKRFPEKIFVTFYHVKQHFSCANLAGQRTWNDSFFDSIHFLTCKSQHSGTKLTVSFFKILRSSQETKIDIYLSYFYREATLVSNYFACKNLKVQMVLIKSHVIGIMAIVLLTNYSSIWTQFSIHNKISYLFFKSLLINFWA